MNNLMSHDRMSARFAQLQDTPKASVTVWNGRPEARLTEKTQVLLPVAVVNGSAAETKTVN